MSAVVGCCALRVKEEEEEERQAVKRDREKSYRSEKRAREAAE